MIIKNRSWRDGLAWRTRGLRLACAFREADRAKWEEIYAREAAAEAAAEEYMFERHCW